MVRQSKPKLLTSRAKRARMEISNSLTLLPNEVLEKTFSFLSTKDLPAVGQVLFYEIIIENLLKFRIRVWAILIQKPFSVHY